jgi:hypothetical protein
VSWWHLMALELILGLSWFLLEKDKGCKKSLDKSKNLDFNKDKRRYL